MIERRSAALLVALLAGGCTVGPDYVRPEVDVPKDYGVAQAPAPAPQRWWTLFGDRVLDGLVEEALAGNRDLRIAAARIDQARAQFGIVRADQLPTAGVEGRISRDRASESGAMQFPADSPETTTHRLVVRASWEIDFWGKYRRASEAAMAELFASDSARDAVRASLVAEVVRGYFALRALDRRIEALERTLAGRRKALELQQLRLDAGIVSELEFRQVESDLKTSQALVPRTRQERVRQEGALAVLLGRSPREIFATKLEPLPAPPALTAEVPAGLPSDLLLRRPDLREAEARLHAATARIGVARAAMFPSITLTGFFGGESQDLGDIFSSASRTWSLAGGVLHPLLAAGRIQGGIDLADARAREATELYQKVVAVAFREVRDAIAAQSNARESLLAQREREAALERTVVLARLRYDNGAVSLFEVLEIERQQLLARLEAIEAERERAAAIVDLYLALGS